MGDRAPRSEIQLDSSCHGNQRVFPHLPRTAMAASAHGMGSRLSTLLFHGSYEAAYVPYANLDSRSSFHTSSGHPDFRVKNVRTHSHPDRRDFSPDQRPVLPRHGWAGRRRPRIRPRHCFIMTHPRRIRFARWWKSLRAAVCLIILRKNWMFLDCRRSLI